MARLLFTKIGPIGPAKTPWLARDAVRRMWIREDRKSEPRKMARLSIDQHRSYRTNRSYIFSVERPP